jgi:hypothetical protein
MVFFVKLRAFVSSWQKETKLNSYLNFKNDLFATPAEIFSAYYLVKKHQP